MMALMTHRERVLAAVDRQETDRTPLDFGGTLATSIVPSTYEKLKRHLGETHPTTIGWKRQQLVLPAESILKRFDVDTRPLKLGDYDGGKTKVLSTHKMLDHWGTTWSKEAGGHYLNVDGPFYKTEADPALIEVYDWPDPDNPGFYQGLKQQAEDLHHGTDYAVILDLGIGIVTRAQFVRGFMEFLIDMTLHPEFAKCLLDKLGRIWIRIARNALQQVGHLVDVVFWGDDYGMQEAPMFRPQHFTDLIKPVNQRMVAAVKELSDARVLLHSCGSVAPMIADMIDTGIDALNPVQVSADNMGAAKLKADFGDRLAFWGGIDTQDVLPFKTPAEVRENVRFIIKTLGEGGGYVLSTVHNIQEQVPPENIVAMFEACLSARN
jgi:uroporphyrinogen decarboxylase